MIALDSILQEKRREGDALADNTLKVILDSKELGHVNHVFMSLTRNQQLSKDLPAEVLSYFEQSGNFGFEPDLDKLAMGERVFRLYGPALFMVLFCKSLPEAYSCWRGARVLVETGKMTEQDPTFHVYARRLMETAQFVMNVMVDNGLGEGGKGIITIQKVRLVHASIRHYLLEKGWDVETFGMPINQEDALGTLLSFSVSVIEGLEKLNVILTPEEIEGYYYTWKIAGPLIGVDPAIIPPSYEDAIEVKKLILQRQGGPSEYGRILTTSAIDFMNHITPGHIFNAFPGHLMHYLVGDTVASHIGLDDHGGRIDHIALKVFKFFDHVVESLGEHSALIRKVSGFFEKKLLEAIFRHYNERKQIHFFIPPSLKEDWGLPDKD